VLVGGWWAGCEGGRIFERARPLKRGAGHALPLKGQESLQIRRVPALTNEADLDFGTEAHVWGQALAQDFGAVGAQIEEIVTMDDSEFAKLAPVYGLIFLFKWTQEMAQAHKTSSNCESSRMLSL
jgi:hypothetical protein